MILKWLALSIVLDVLSCTEKMFKLPRRGCFIKETKKGRAIALEILESWVFKLFQFMVLIWVFRVYWEVFRVFLGLFLVFRGCSRFFGCSGMFQCSSVPVPVFLKVLHADAA